MIVERNERKAVSARFSLTHCMYWGTSISKRSSGTAPFLGIITCSLFWSIIRLVDAAVKRACYEGVDGKIVGLGDSQARILDWEVFTSGRAILGTGMGLMAT